MAGRAGRKTEGVVYVFESRDKLHEVVAFRLRSVGM